MRQADTALLEGHRWRCTRCGAETWTMMVRNPERFLMLPLLPDGWQEYHLESGHLAYRCRACPAPRSRLEPPVSPPAYTRTEYSVGERIYARL